MTKNEALNLLVSKARELKRFTAAALAETTGIAKKDTGRALSWMRDLGYTKFDKHDRVWNYIR